jgi:hypothetical protein
MKKCLYTAALLGSSLAVHAETPVTMHTPFAFAAAGKILPAGDYRLQVVTPGVLLIAGEDSGARVLALVNQSPGSARASVAFEETGEAPALKSVTTALGTWSLTSPTSSHIAVALRSKK